MNSHTVTAKPTAPATAEPPTLHSNTTHAEFGKFKVDWGVYKQLLLPPTQIASSLYNPCQDSVQNAVVNTVQNFLTLAEADILIALKKNSHSPS